MLTRMKEPHTLLVKCKVVQPLWKTIWWFLKLNIELPCDPIVLLTGLYLRNENICPHRKTCTQMFITALFIIAKRWK